MERLGKKTGRREFKPGILTFRDGGWECARRCRRARYPLLHGRRQLPIVLEEDRGDVAAGELVTVERSRIRSSHARRHHHRAHRRVKGDVRDLLRDAARRLPHLR